MEEGYRRITVPNWEYIPAGEKIANGYSNGYCIAPSKPGRYTLYEIADQNNQHVGWEWEKVDVTNEEALDWLYSHYPPVGWHKAWAIREYIIQQLGGDLENLYEQF